MRSDRAPELVDHLFRHHYGRLVAGLTRVFGAEHLDLVEDVVQDALMKALRLWPFEGIPERPESWLVRVAHNRALDALRHHALADRHALRLEEWARRAADEQGGRDEEIADDSLRMIFTCCHPALAGTARVALTLKTLCGFGVAEIAAALLQKEATIAQRLSRAKARLQGEPLPFEVPGPKAIGERLASVLDVVYLVFNEGWSAHVGDALVRKDLVKEALRLGRLITEIPETRRPEAWALRALMEFLAARLPARTDALGDLLTLAEQDRSLWDREGMARGFDCFRRAIGGDRMTAFHVEASIASLHAVARRYEDTDWPAILARYDQLTELRDDPVVRLNRAVAVAKVRGARAGLAELARLEHHPSLARYHLLPATRGQLLWVAGDHAGAAAAFEAALGLTSLAVERRLLSRRLAATLRREPAPAF